MMGFLPPGPHHVPTGFIPTSQANAPAGLWGTAAERPTACASLLGMRWTSTDVNGGTEYECRNIAAGGFEWVQITSGLTPALAGSISDMSTPDVVTNTISETAFAKTIDIATSRLADGDVLTVDLWGTYSLDAILAPTIQLKFKLDGVLCSDSGVITSLVAAASNLQWNARISGVVQSVGAGGTIDCQGEYGFALVGMSAKTYFADPNTTLPALDTTQVLTASVTAQWGTADVDNVITLRQFNLWIN